MTSSFKVHEEGRVGISCDNGRLLTWGSDSLVKSWPNGLSQECQQLDMLGEIRAISSTSHKGKTFVHIASDSVDSETFEWPGLLEDKNFTLFRFSCDIGCITSLRSNESIQCAAGSGDFKVKWRELYSGRDCAFQGHEAPVLSVSLDPREKIVASSSCDGTLRIWDLDDKSESFKTKIWLRCSDIDHAKSPAVIEIQPKSGDLIALLTQDGIKVMDRSDFKFLHEITNMEKPTTLAWSRDDGVLAVALKHKVKIFDSMNWTEVHEIQIEKEVTSIAFGKTELHIADLSGMLTSVQTSVFQKTPQKILPEPIVQKVKEKIKKIESFVDNEAQADDDGDDEEADDLEALWEGEAGNDDGGMGDDFGDDPMAMDDDDNAISLNAIKEQVPLENRGEDELSDGEGDNISLQGMMQPSKMQSAFQPGSSPIFNAQRYLCWNSTGIIKGIIDEQNGISSIIVDFHDVSVHHSIQIPNQQDFQLGDLSDKVIILASRGEREGEDKTRSIIKVMNFASWWDKNREWSIDLPRREFADCVAASLEYCAVATSERYIRMFSHGGAQLKLVSIPGAIITISSNLEQLFYTYHRARGFDGEQFISCGILSMQPQTAKSIPQDIGLSNGTEIVWTGFTDEGSPAVYDTRGIVRIVSWGTGQWLPIANTKAVKKMKSVDWWYLISINEGNKEIAAVLCHNSTYPEVHPRPEIEVLRINMPLLNPKSEISVQEADLIMNGNIGGTIEMLQSRGYRSDPNMEELIQKQITKSILKLLLGAIVQDADDRGFEICTMLQTPQQVQMAVRLANQKGRVKLAQRLNQLAREKAEEPEDSDDSDDDEIEEVIHQTTSATIGSSSSSSASRDLFKRAEKPQTNLIKQKTSNPFAKSTAEDNKENEKAPVLDDLPKMEVQRAKPKSAREKLANFRKQQKKAEKVHKASKVQSKISFGKRKEASDVEPLNKKPKPSTTPVATPVATINMNLDDFAHSDSE